MSAPLNSLTTGSYGTLEWRTRKAAIRQIDRSMRGPSAEQAAS